MKAQILSIEVILRIIIAIFLIVPLANCVADYVAGSSKEATDSFLNLAKNLREMSADTQLYSVKSFAFTMDTDTAIAGFTKDSQAIEAGIAQTDGSFDALFSYKRPEQCAKGEACLCVCKKGWDFVDGTLNEVTCEKELRCEVLKDVQLDSDIPVTSLGLNAEALITYNNQAGEVLFKREPGSMPVTPELSIYHMRGGFLFERGATTRAPFRLRFDERLNAIYVEKKQGALRVCFVSPCFPVESPSLSS